MGGGQGENNTVIRKKGWRLNVGGGLGGEKFKIGASFARTEQLDGQGREVHISDQVWVEGRLSKGGGGHQLPFKGGSIQRRMEARGNVG